MRQPRRSYKQISDPVRAEIKQKLIESNQAYIPDTLVLPIGISKEEKDKLDDLTDFEYIDDVLRKPIELKALMVFETERRRSLRPTWKHEGKVKGKELARAGFYFFGSEDQVKCAFCSGTLGEWEKGDHPMERHRRSYSFCKFVQGKSAKNIPVDDIGKASLYKKALSDPHNDEELEDPREGDSPNFRSGEAYSPEYAAYDSRKASYSRGCKMLLQPLIAKLCDAGLFNKHPTNQSDDKTECFYCGGVIDDWEGDEDPWAEHAKWFYKCPFLIESKGYDYIKVVRDKMSEQDRHESENTSYQISTLNPPASITASIKQKKKRLRKSESYEYVYTWMEFSDELIMQAFEVNNWEDSTGGLLQCIYRIKDEEIALARYNEQLQQVQQPQLTQLQQVQPPPQQVQQPQLPQLQQVKQPPQQVQPPLQQPQLPQNPQLQQEQAQAAIPGLMLEADLIGAIVNGDEPTSAQRESLRERRTTK